MPDFSKNVLASLPTVEGRGGTMVIKWLCDPSSAHNRQRDNHYGKSIAHELGIEISSYSRNQAKLILLTEQQLVESEKDIRLLLNRPEFKRYKDIFDNYGFGLGMRGLLLYKIFPFEKFLLEDGQPWLVQKTTDDGKIIFLDKSQAAFQSCLGLSKRIEQSGDGISTKWNGSTLVRSHLYIWLIATVAKKEARSVYPKRVIPGDKWDRLMAKGVKGKDACIRCCYTLTRMLYTDLLKS